MVWFVMVLGIMLWIEYRIYKTCITPFFIIGMIYLCAVPLVNILGSRLGYYSITNKTIVCFTVYLSVIYISDLIFKVSASRFTEKEGGLQVILRQQKIVWYIFVLFLAGYFLSFLQAVDIYGIENIKGKSSGIFGHMGLACIAISPFISVYCIRLKKIKYFLGIVFLYFLMLSFGGKTYIFISLLTSCVLNYQDKRMHFHKMVKLGMVLGCLGVGVFIGIYAILPGIRGSLPMTASSLKEALQHFFYYLSAPFLGSNTYFNLPVHEGMYTGIRIMMAPLVTIWELLTGNKQYPSIIMSYWAPISEFAHRTSSNVGGLFSEGVYRIGYLGTGIYVFAVGLYSSVFFFIKRISPYFWCSSSLAITLVGLCFFCNYFTLLVVLELIIYTIFLELFLKLMDQKKKYIKDWRFKKIWKTVKL